jgi:hypothetical protein
MASQETGHKTQIIVALIAGTAALGGALIANWDKLQGGSQSGGERAPYVSPDDGARDPDEPKPRREPKRQVVDISGSWQDNWGITSTITQSGSTFSSQGSGSGCLGFFQATGSGTIDGNTFTSSYRTTYSTGTCSGTILSGGARMTSTCNDTVCGPFTSSATRH